MPRTARHLSLPVAVAAVALALTGCSALGGAEPETRDTTGVITEAGTTDVFTIAEGDCLNDELSEEAVDVTDVPTLPCDEPHDYEVFRNVTMTGDAYPGVEATETQANDDCVAAFAEFVGVAYEESAYEFSYYYPTEESWSNGDRIINCLITDPNGKSTGTLAGAAA